MKETAQSFVKLNVLGRREAIVNEAAKLFSERGYGATSIRDIADAAQVRSASLYHHFQSKDEIFLEVSKQGVDAVFHAVRTAVEALPDTAPCRARVRAALDAHIRTALDVQACTSVNIRCMNQVPDAVRTRARTLRQPYEKYWRSLLRSGIEGGEIDPRFETTLLSLFIFGLMNWTIEWFPGGRWPLENIVDDQIDFIFDGAGKG